MKEELLEIIENEKELNITYHGIKKLLNSSKKKIDEELNHILFELECEGIIYEDDDFVYHKFPKNYKVATIVQNNNGKNYVKLNNNFHEIKDNKLHSALNGDKVIVKKSKKSKTYEVIKILKRAKGKILCELRMDENNNLYLKDIYSKGEYKIGISKKILRRYNLGQKFLVNLYTTRYDEYYDAEIDTVLGNVTKIEEIALANGTNPNFSQETYEELKHIPTTVSDDEIKGRLDLRDKRIVTIDCDTAKDLDDAVLVEKLENGHYLLYVNIAHVSHYVKYDSAIFKDAFERGTSYYLLNKVFPMLPKELSNGICSLNEGVDRLTRTVIMEYDENGNQIDYRIVKAVINSKKKMTYSNVNKILEENIIPNGYEPFENDLKTAYELTSKINKNKVSQGKLDFDSSEQEIIYDEKENIKEIYVTKAHASNDLIETSMIEANCTIARDFYYKKLPFIYRNHNVPDVDRFVSSIKFITSLGFKIDKIKDVKDPHVIQKILNSLMNKKEFPILSSYILRAMEKAGYDINNIGHCGLAENCYTHFTSPIRRLCDLVVHMLIDYYEENFPNEEEIEKLEAVLQSAAIQASIKERDEIRAEAQSKNLSDIWYMQNFINQQFSVYVTDINESVIRVKTDNLVEGIIPYKELNWHYYFDPKTKQIKNLENGKIIKVTSNLNVTLVDANEDEREIFFNFPFILKREKQLERQRKRESMYR